MPRDDIVHTNIVAGESLNVGGTKTLGKDFPMGQGWYKLNLRINLALTVGTGSGPITEGELIFIKKILFRTDRGETICNLPARALYHIAQFLSGTLARKDAIAAATATYRVNIPIYLADRRMLRPEDTILDTARYSSVRLELQMGTVADLLGAVGTSSVLVTADVEIEHSASPLPENAQPIFHVSYFDPPPQDPSVQTFIDHDRSHDLSYKRLYHFSSSSADSGSGFTGAAADDEVDKMSLKDHEGFIIQERFWEMIQDQNKEEFGIETLQTGWAAFDLVPDRSNMSALFTGDKARLQSRWDNETVAASDQVSVAVEGLRTLK